MRPGGPFLCSPFLLGPAPAASPEISQGRPGPGAVATFRGDDGAAAGAAAPRGTAPALHAGASPGAPHHLRWTPRQLFRFRPGFPHERGKVGRHRGGRGRAQHTPGGPDTRSVPQAQRGGGGPPCQHIPARGSARRRLPLLLAPRQEPLPPPAHRHCRCVGAAGRGAAAGDASSAHAPSPAPQGTRARARAPWSSTPTSRTSGWERPSPAGTATWWWVHPRGMWAALGVGGAGSQPVPSPCPGLCPAAALERFGGAARGVPHPHGHLLGAERGAAPRGVVLALPRPDHGQHPPPDELR